MGHSFSNLITVFQIRSGFSNGSRFSKGVMIFQIGSQFFKLSHDFSNWVMVFKWVTVFQIGPWIFKLGYSFSNLVTVFQMGHDFSN